MRKAFFLAAIGLISGCASVGDLRDKGPSLNFISEKSSDQLSECITAAWDEVKIAGSPPAIRQQHIGDVYSVLNGPSNITEMVDISPSRNGSIVKFYHAKGLALWRTDHFSDAIKPCL